MSIIDELKKAFFCERGAYAIVFIILICGMMIYAEVFLESDDMNEEVCLNEYLHNYSHIYIDRDMKMLSISLFDKFGACRAVQTMDAILDDLKPSEASSLE